MPETRPFEEPVHDVLAAEMFAVPAPDPALNRRPVVLPDDPTGIAEPHDVLAAEEFAMPAPCAVAKVPERKVSHRLESVFAAVVLAFLLARRLRSAR